MGQSPKKLETRAAGARRSVSMSYARTHLSALIPAAQRGAVTIVTKRGRAVAIITPVEQGFQLYPMPGRSVAV